MMHSSRLSKILFAVISVAAGVIIGLGIGQIQAKKVRKAADEKIREVNKKIAVMQKKMNEEMAESVRVAQQACEGNRAALEKLEDEKTAFEYQNAKLREQIKKLEIQTKEAADALARTAKESDETSGKLKKEIQTLEHNLKEMEEALKKAAGEKQSLHADLKKKTQELGVCVSHNAELCSIAEELVAAYKNKGLGTVLLQKEPLTQIKKVQLEQLTQRYRDQINQKKMTNK